MAPRRRGSGKPRIPNLYESKGYYSWKNPKTGKFFGLGRNKSIAIEQAVEANLHMAGLLEKPRLVDRVAGNAFTFGDWLDRYEELLAKRERAEATRRGDKVYLKRARADFDVDLPIRQITALMVSEKLDALAEAGKRRTAVAFRSFLLDCFREAMVKGRVDVNPVAVTRAEKPGVLRSRLTLDVFMAAYQACRTTWLRNAMALALTSGQRREDILNLEFKRDVHDEALWVVQAKTGAMVAIPQGLRLQAFGMSLGEVIAQCRSTGVLSRFLVHQTRPYGNSPVGSQIWVDTLSRRFTDLILSLGLNWGDKEPPTFHEIRSLAERLYSAQGNVNTQELLGHRSRRMTEVYHDARGAEWVKVSVK